VRTGPGRIPDGAAVCEGLRQALALAGSAFEGTPLEPMADKGLAHDHIRLVGTGLLARIPKQSQLQLSAGANLAYQRACFERASPAGHAPRLHATLPPSVHLSRGALLVEEIVGRAASLPGDVPAIARALASLHALALPPPDLLKPLLHAADPLRDLSQEIDQQARHLDAAGLSPEVRVVIDRERMRLRERCEGPHRPAVHLIAFDGHPGNFIIRPDGEAVLVDLEKCRYAYPGLDLAHATLYTSTTWDLESNAVLTLPQVLGAYDAWSNEMGGAATEPARPWQLPLRRAMWLWSATWCAKWRVLSGRSADATADGEDWSAQRSAQSLVAHVRDRVDHYLSPEGVRRVQAEFEALDLAWHP
jgi:thiamine kinase-like enzyme